MAEVQRYVNTASTAGGDGTTNATTGANRAYASLNEWEAAEQTDLVTAGDNHVVTCTGGVDTTAVTLAGWTTNATNNITIEVATGSRHDGTPGTGYRLSVDANYTGAVQIEQVGTVIDGVSVINAGSAQNRGISISGNQTDVVVKNCIAKATSDNITGSVRGFVLEGSGVGVNTEFFNCLAYECTEDGFLVKNYKRAYFYNCTSVDNGGAGFERQGTNNVRAVARNCVAYGNTTNWAGTHWENTESGYNATGDATTTDVPGSNNIAGITSSDFNDTANDDYTHPSGSALVDAGEDLSTEYGAAGVAVEDAVGTNRPQGSAFDIGFFEFVAAGGGPDPLVAETGSFTLTGFAANLLFNRLLAAVTGTFSLTGQAVGLLRSLLLRADTTSFTLTGNDAGFTRKYVLTAETGDFSLTGNDATLARSLTLPAETGSFALTGLDVAFEQTTVWQAQGNGEVTDDGGADITRRGFVYDTVSRADPGNTDPDVSDYANVADETGTFGAVTYDLLLTGLDPNTTYYVRAFAENSEGFSYGDEVSFDTTGALEAETGTFTLTGNAAALLRSLLLEAETGAFALTGNEANLTRKYVLTAETGSFALSGKDATLSRSYVLTAEAGTFALTGQDADLLRSLRLGADTGSFTLTGQDAELRRGFRLIAETGTFSLTGNEIAFSRNYVLEAETGTFALTGNEANLAAGQRLEAETASFALTGQDATLRRSYVLTAETASFALTGNEAALAKRYHLAAETGSFALTGLDVAFSRNYVITAETGIFTLTGFQAAITAEEVLLAATGAFSFTGNDAELRVKRHLSVETGAFLLSGQDAGLNAARLISAAPGAFLLTGQDAALLRGFVLNADTGEFVLSPFAAELRRDAILDAGTGSFTLVGVDADLRVSGEFDRIFTPRSGLFSRRTGAFTPRGSLFTRRQ